MKNYHDLSLWELALSATWFDPLVAAHGVLEEPVPSDACASKRQLIVHRGVSCSLPVMQDQTLVLGLTLRGVVLATRRITRDDVA